MYLIYSDGLKSADYYWSFDEKDSKNYYKVISKGQSSSTVKLKSSTDVLRILVPGRSTPVAYFIESTKYPIYSNDDLQCLK